MFSHFYTSTTIRRMNGKPFPSRYNRWYSAIMHLRKLSIYYHIFALYYRELSREMRLEKHIFTYLIYHKPQRKLKTGNVDVTKITSFACILCIYEIEFFPRILIIIIITASGDKQNLPKILAIVIIAIAHVAITDHYPIAHIYVCGLTIRKRISTIQHEFWQHFRLSIKQISPSPSNILIDATYATDARSISDRRVMETDQRGMLRNNLIWL